MIQTRKLHINAARNYHTEKRCIPSRVQPSPVPSSKVQSNNSSQQHLTPSHRTTAMLVMGHGQKHEVPEGQVTEQQALGEAFVFNLVT